MNQLQSKNLIHTRKCHGCRQDFSCNDLGYDFRIKEFHCFNSQTVVGLREGSFLEVLGDRIILKGPLSARIFRANTAPYESKSGSDLSQLI